MQSPQSRAAEIVSSFFREGFLTTWASHRLDFQPTYGLHAQLRPSQGRHLGKYKIPQTGVFGL